MIILKSHMPSMRVTSHYIDSISHHYKLFNEFFALFPYFGGAGSSLRYPGFL